MFNKNNDKKLKESLNDFKKNPSAQLAKRIGFIYFHAKKYKKAIEFYQKQIDLEGMNADNLYDLACCYHYNNDFKTAYKYYLDALDINNKHIKSINNIGCLLYETKNYQDSVDTFKKSISMLKRNPEAHFYLGILHRDFYNDIELSILHLNRAIFYDPKHKQTYEELIKTYQKENNAKKVEELTSFIKENFSR